jgi:hypothetical protein
MLYNPEPVAIVDFDAWFGTDIASKQYLLAVYALSNTRKQDDAFVRLTKLHIVKEHQGTLVLNSTFREQFKSALTGEYLDHRNPAYL